MRTVRLNGGSLLRRTLALLIDLLFCSAITIAPFLLGSFSLAAFHPPANRFLPDHLLELLLYTPFTLLTLPLWALTVFLFWHTLWLVFSRGRTLGLIITGLRVVDRHGDPPSIPTLLLRTLGHLLSALSLGLGWLWILLTPTRRGWPDLIARSHVVRI